MSPKLMGRIAAALTVTALAGKGLAMADAPWPGSEPEVMQNRAWAEAAFSPDGAIGVNSHSVMRVTLDKPAERFLADIGLDRNVADTTALEDGTEVWLDDLTRQSVVGAGFRRGVNVSAPGVTTASTRASPRPSHAHRGRGRSRRESQ